MTGKNRKTSHRNDEKEGGKVRSSYVFCKGKRTERAGQGEKDGSGTKNREKIVRRDRRKPLENKGLEKEGKKSKKNSKKVLTKKRVRGIMYKLA